MKRKVIVNFANKLSGIEGHNEILQIYNKQNPLPRGYTVKFSDAWCATFVSAVFLKYNCNIFSECSCPQMIEKAKKAGIWIENDAYKPTMGDVILYDWQDTGIGDDTGEADHVGIVIHVTNNMIYVREGNKSGTIGNRTVAINGKYIRGYIVPKFDDTTNNTNINNEDIHKFKTIEEIVDAIIKGYFGNGEDRKNNIYDYFQNLVNDKLSK